MFLSFFIFPSHKFSRVSSNNSPPNLQHSQLCLCKLIFLDVTTFPRAYISPLSSFSTISCTVTPPNFSPLSIAQKDDATPLYKGRYPGCTFKHVILGISKTLLFKT